jgi:hypothetical protein
MSNLFSDFKPYFTFKFVKQDLFVYGDELRRILTFISDLTHNDTNSTVKDTQITGKANVPFKEIR